MSNHAKQDEKKREKLKRVHFANPLVNSSPKTLKSPKISLCFGDFESSFDPSRKPENLFFPSPVLDRRTVQSSGSCGSPSAKNTPLKEAGSIPLHSNSNAHLEAVICYRCFDLGHNRRFC